jgi:hypothetical protein
MITTTEKRPTGREWTELRYPLPIGGNTHAASAWESGPIRVLSSLQTTQLPGRAAGELGPQWLVSISHLGRRPKPHHVRRALRAFGMVGAENDTHHPGNAVHFWLPCDPALKGVCECKTDEETIVDPDGYTWTNPREGEGDCRGCEIAPVTGRPCRIHAAPAAAP